MSEIKTYPNGLTLVVENRNSAGLVYFRILYKAGSAKEKENEIGAAHFLEHLHFKSSKFHTTEEIAKILEGYGTEINASTGKNLTEYHFTALKEYFEPSLKMYAEMLFDGILNQDEFEMEKKVVIEEIKRMLDNSSKLCYEQAYNTHYAGTGYAHPILGTFSSIENMTRDDILGFKKENYTANETIISVCGDITIEECDNLVQKYFLNRLQNNQSIQDNLIETPQLGQQYTITNKEDKQVNLVIMYNGPTCLDKEFAAYDIFSTIMGEGLSSRLFVELREKKGLCYSTACYVNGEPDIGSLSFYIGTSIEKLEKVLVGFENVVAKVANEGVSEEEFVKAKNKYMVYLYRELESNGLINLRNTSQIRKYGRLRSIEERLAEIESVTIKDIQNVATSILNDKNFTISAVGKDISLDVLKEYKQDK